ncbi:MAG TPA: winged helix-turn-helix transcriptional regulator [Saprospiraceae bacterium]|nr:winged helix-turn-helix transcriptional regulator [Saprospiraceae bacterium]HQW54846.1 winged helix-turn-helix transcriptional regulator [Saprospiraceae bacterium]
MNKEYELDKIDKQILSILMKNANATYAEIAALLEVSGGTIHVRMKKLEQIGVITGMHLITDYSKLGYHTCCYIGLTFSEGADYSLISKEIENIPEVTHFNYVTGRYNGLLEVSCMDNKHLKNILHFRISTIPGIGHCEVFMSLQSIISRKIDLIEIEKQKTYELE